MNTLFLRFLKDMQNEGRLKFYENHSLSLVSTFGIGGMARFFIIPYDTDTLCRVVRFARNIGRYKVIGNASNLLFDDCGFKGSIISTVKIKNISFSSDAVLYAECGAMLPSLCRFAAENAICGFEGLCSIPATVGGALCLNAGAYGTEISDKLQALRLYCPKTNSICTVKADKTAFSYRKSPISESGKIVIGAFFTAEAGNTEQIQARMQKCKELRLANQPQGVKSAGSYFKRPSENEGFENFRNKSAGALIDLCGLKGLRVGCAEVSRKHANFLINSNGNATSKDVLKLAKIIKNVVYKKTGIILKEEVEFIPFNP